MTVRFEVNRTANHASVDPPQLFDSNTRPVPLVCVEGRHLGHGPCTYYEYDYAAELQEGEEYWLIFKTGLDVVLEYVIVSRDGRVLRHVHARAAFYRTNLPNTIREAFLAAAVSLQSPEAPAKEGA